MPVEFVDFFAVDPNAVNAGAGNLRYVGNRGANATGRVISTGTLSTSEESTEVPVIAPGNGSRAKTYEFSGEDAYTARISMVSVSAIKRAFTRQNPTILVNTTVNFEADEYYSEHVKTGSFSIQWLVNAHYSGNSIYRISTRWWSGDFDPNVYSNDDNEQIKITATRSWLQSTIRGLIIGSSEPILLWDYLRSNIDARILSPSERAQMQFHVSNEEYKASFSTSFASVKSDVSWVDDFSAFQSQWNDTKTQDMSTPEFRAVDNALNGVNDYITERGRSFGIELEIDFPEDPAPYEARGQFATAMHEAGLSRSAQVHGWHFAAREGNRDRVTGEISTGYTDARNGWSVEFDRSVDDVDGARGCEVVSPILYDTAQAWADIATVCHLAESFGGKVTARHGLHVNIGARDFALDVQTHYRLVRLMRQFDDILIRLAHNPVIGQWHRGRAYCGLDTFFDLASEQTLNVLKHYHSHMSNINLDHMPYEGQRVSNSTRVEFRIFDGSLEPGRIQMYVSLAMSLIAAAIRGVTLEIDEEPAGTHRELRRGRRLSGDDWKADTERIRLFADEILGSDSLRVAAITAYGASRWQRS